MTDLQVTQVAAGAWLVWLTLCIAMLNADIQFLKSRIDKLEEVKK